MIRTQFQGIAHWRPLPYLVALLFTLMILGIHMLPSMDSMLNENNTRISHGFLRSQIDYHQEIAPFARRPFTSFLIEGAVRKFRIRAGHAFILVNFLLLFLSGVFLFRLSKVLQANTAQALGNLTIYFLSFSVLFAFFPPVFSYDEPLQYCFIFLSLTAFVRKKRIAFVVLFTLALISRETSVLLLPALVFFARSLGVFDPNQDISYPNPDVFLKDSDISPPIPTISSPDPKGLRRGPNFFSPGRGDSSSDTDAFSNDPEVTASRLEKSLNIRLPKVHLNQYIVLLLPLLLYGIYLVTYIYTQDQLKATRIEMASRYSCFLENFESTKNTVESWASIYLALGPFLYLVALRNALKSSPASHTKWMEAFLLTVLINTPIVIMTAFARETRLFALPLFFLWPMFGQIFGRDIRRVFLEGHYSAIWREWRPLSLFIIGTGANYWFCFHFYPSLGLGENTFYGEYLFVVNVFLLTHFLLQGMKSKHSRQIR